MIAAGYEMGKAMTAFICDAVLRKVQICKTRVL